MDSIFGTIGHMVTRTHLIAFDADFDNELAFSSAAYWLDGQEETDVVLTGMAW